ncbi:OLC1v1016025C1 [Oldenlandia corymbosa var. corymbosa]|uniref:OLC1v1016025C1 n=1 Tax=Oldenlandia corymbosa var. corymbosa TaxID=529605 RepID=A0AAV1E6G3_OLDCO|nr:OLC1v1016025C1 [Oldenlandia corymbosa var. corymbosa]
MLNMSRPSIARVSVELDLLHELPRQISLGIEEYSYYQQVTYENLPEYCMDCRKIGHSSHNCQHGKAKASPVKEKEQPATVKEKEHSVSQLATKAAHLAKKASQPARKTKDTKDAVAGKENNHHKDWSTSSLTETEKMDILTDIGDSSPLIPQDKRLLSKERLSAILEKSLQEENLKNTWEEDDIANNNVNAER